jgi:hypothetical protein
MDKWEYAGFYLKQGVYLDVFIRSTLEELNKSGQDGWELVNFSPTRSNTFFFVFKRKIG